MEVSDYDEILEIFNFVQKLLSNKRIQKEY
jgi:hypothetical protein